MVHFFCKLIPKSGWYVYEITENGSVCYVGKGKGNRVKSHFSSSNRSTISNKINMNPKAFGWRIVEVFEKEIDALDFERELIFNYRENAHPLYNSTHYTNRTANWHFFNLTFRVLSQLSTLYFHREKTKHLPLRERGKIIVEAIKGVLKKVPVSLIPLYEGIPIDKLGFEVVQCGDYEQLKYYEQND